MAPVNAGTLLEDVERYPWYHTLDLGQGVVTKGMFDIRESIRHYPLPEDLSGLRCLDVGTMDGFWAFELERRGAAEVVATDIEDPEALDWPASIRDQPKELDATKAERFELARQALGSKVERVGCSIYDLSTEQLGSFDFVFCGDVLLHLKDPVSAVERIHSVCRDRALIVNEIKRFRFQEWRALAELDGIDGFDWWVTNLKGLERLVRAAGFSRVEAAKPFKVPPTYSTKWHGRRGAVTAWV
jgi:tRNA (mo5U34)-methyltransferase